jgi:alkylhydroperoxidase/carboxymuconolactone decarboxylase family protein YurZ
VTGVDIELARAALVVGLVIAALVYHTTRIASGGVVTGPYLALMALNEEWLNIGGWLVLSLVGFAAITVVSRTWPLPRSWLFAIGVFAPAVLHVVLMWLAGAPPLNELSAYLAAGLYVTNGLSAYDAKRQGIVRTLTAAAGVGGATWVVVTGIKTALDSVRDRPPEMSAPTLQEPLLVLASIAVALAVRVALGWGTAGIIGALFFVEILTLASALFMASMILVGALVYRVFRRYVGLSPKERFSTILILASMFAWTVLFWADLFNLPGAEISRQFGVEPLLVTGLMIGETVRSGLPKMVAGSTLTIGATFTAQWLMLEHPRGSILVMLAVLALVVGVWSLAAAAVRDTWIRVVRVAESFGPENPRQRALRHPRRVGRVDREHRHYSEKVPFRSRLIVVLAAASVAVSAATWYLVERPDHAVTQEPDQFQVETSDLLALKALAPRLAEAHTVEIVGYPLDTSASRQEFAPVPLAGQVELYLKRLAGERVSDIVWVVRPEASTEVSWILTPKNVVEVFID